MGETTGCGMFDFLQKKDGKPQDDAVMIHTEKVQESELEEMKEVQEHSLAEGIHHTRKSSSSSSDEEGRERKKKKKGLKEKIKDKVTNGNEEDTEHKNAPKFVEECNEEGNAEALQPEEKKGFIEKIKEILPGQYKNADEGAMKPKSNSEADGRSETMEKKGFMEKIKDKFPGAHKTGEEKKEI
ncbi:25 kDa protein dehydrin [Heracleum sosnowskyi]|uniref:25 kDa protein dehydrin n=1 Tax=Heracleum sosnowskyi TaxID=360622 RepID=A0AAD8HQ49_9APIA|nr:25 kDa protein dehydrin [Heracleum sosnowskyi]